MKNKPTVTIGIPAFNEEGNIRHVLSSILFQKETNFRIKEILIISDQSTDNTANIVKSIKDKKIRIIENKQRIGNSQNIDKICRLAKGDIIAFFDADVILSDQLTLSNLIQPIIKNRNVGLTSGLSQPRKPESFIEKSIHLTINAYHNMRLELKQGNNIYSCVGKSMAISRGLAKLVNIPTYIYASDAYLYLLCMQNKYKFVYVPSAKILCNIPTNIRDHIKQNTRFVGSYDNVYSIFGNIAEKEYYIPPLLSQRYFFKEAVKKPIHALAILAINLYCKWVAKKRKSLTAVYSTVESTKGKIIHE